MSGSCHWSVVPCQKAMRKSRRLPSAELRRLEMTGRHNLLLIAGGMTLALLTGCNQSGRPLADGTAGPAFNGTAPVMGVVQGSSYIVAPGDTVGAIAERANTPVRTLIDLNHLVPPYRLQSG